LNDVLLEQLANDGNGKHAYMDDLDEAQKLFVENLTSILQVIALDATPAPQAERCRGDPGRFHPRCGALPPPDRV